MTAGFNATGSAGVPPNATGTPMGSINSTPDLILSKSNGAGYNNAGYNPGNNDYIPTDNGKYATYLKLFSGELFKAYESSLYCKGHCAES